MGITLNQNTDCCETTCTSTTVNTPGPQGPTGPAGANGTNGADGANGYSVTTDSFTIPAPSDAVNIPLDHTGWIAATESADSQVVFIADAGHFLVSGKGSSHITVTPLNYDGDPGTAGDVIASGAVVAPAGLRGPAGADGEITGLTAKGQLATYNGLSASADKLSPGADGTALFADSTLNLGIKWKQPAFSDLSGTVDLGGSQVSGQIDISGSSVTGSLPLTDLANSGGAAGDLAYWNGSSWVRLGIGSAGQVLSLSGSTPQWVDTTGPSYAVRTHVTRDYSAATTTSDSSSVNVASVSSTWSVSNPITFTITFTDPIDTTLPLLFSSSDDTAYEITTRSTTSVTFTSTSAATGADHSISVVAFN